MPRINGQWHTPAQYFIRLRNEYPYQVDIKHYRRRLRSKTIPRPEAVPGGASWTKYRTQTGNTQTFGFKTAAEAEAFREEWADEEKVLERSSQA